MIAGFVGNRAFSESRHTSRRLQTMRTSPVVLSVTRFEIIPSGTPFRLLCGNDRNNDVNIYDVLFMINCPIAIGLRHIFNVIDYDVISCENVLTYQTSDPLSPGAPNSLSP